MLRLPTRRARAARQVRRRRRSPRPYGRRERSSTTLGTRRRPAGRLACGLGRLRAGAALHLAERALDVGHAERAAAEWADDASAGGLGRVAEHPARVAVRLLGVLVVVLREEGLFGDRVVEWRERGRLEIACDNKMKMKI